MGPGQCVGMGMPTTMEIQMEGLRLHQPKVSCTTAPLSAVTYFSFDTLQHVSCVTLSAAVRHLEH